MRRLRDRRPGGMFRAGELPRLLTMIVLLGVIVLLIRRAGDEGTWRWLAPGGGTAPTGSGAPDREITAAEPGTIGPTDEDPLEADAAREEFQAVTDKTPLAKEEMSSYWRLIAWERHQSTAALLKRAASDVAFKQLWQHPEKWRGRLVQISVHLRRTERIDELADNALGLKTMNEVWGWNSGSQPYWYWMVCPQLPPGMPTGNSIYEEATFVGYFLKLLPYEDHEGKTLATPLLIGRLIWHPAADELSISSGRWGWPWLLAGPVAVWLATRFGLKLFGARLRQSIPERAGQDQQAVEAWLEHADRSDEDDGAARERGFNDDLPAGEPRRGENAGPSAREPG